MFALHSALVIAAASTNGLGAALTSSGAAYAITANSAGDSVAHLLTFQNISATNHSGKTITFVGTDENSNPLTETITGPAGSATVTTTKYFKTVTSVTPSASTGADTFNVGWAVTSVSAWVYPNRNTQLPMNIGVGVTVVSGSPNYTLQRTYDASAWFAHSTITGKTASFDGVETTPCMALRLAFTVAGTLSATYIQHDGNA